MAILQTDPLARSRLFDGPAFREEPAKPPTAEQVVADMVAEYGNKTRTVIHLVGGGKPVSSVLPLDVSAHQLSNAPQTLLLIPKRTDHGTVKPAFLRAGAIAYVEGP